MIAFAFETNNKRRKRMNRNRLKWITSIVLISLLLTTTASFASGESDNGLPLIIELAQEDIIEVTDGDTFNIKPIHESLPVRELKNDDDYVPIRVAGINCAEKRDQASWLSAKHFTEDFLGSNDPETHTENPDTQERIEYMYQIEYIGNGDNNRALAFVTRRPIQYDDNTENEDVESDTQEDSDLVQEDLGQSLIEHGLSIPALSRFVSDSEYEPYKEKGKQYTQAAVKCYNSPPEGDTLWAVDNLEDNIKLALTPYSDDKSDDDKCYTKGNKITLSWNSNPSIEYLDLDGYSLMDENAPSNWSDHRFFFPDVTLGVHTSEVRVWLHTPDPDKDFDHWIIYNEDGSYDLLALLYHNFITKDSKGESIFLRNPNRQIVLWRYWNGEETVEPEEIHISLD
jgi:hypothetical protein